MAEIAALILLHLMVVFHLPVQEQLFHLDQTQAHHVLTMELIRIVLVQLMVLVKLDVLLLYVMVENVIKEMQVHANVMEVNVGKKDVAQWHVMEDTAVLIPHHLLGVFHLPAQEQLFLLDLDHLQLLVLIHQS